jgi:hypothetical protein
LLNFERWLTRIVLSSFHLMSPFHDYTTLKSLQDKL